MIEIRDLWKTFKLSKKQRAESEQPVAGNVAHAVAGISLTCQPGRIFTLLGPNGAGKTTTLRMIATLMKPTSGSIRVGGVDTVEDPVEVRRRIGFLTGSTKLYDRLTPLEVVRFYADVHGVDKGTFDRRAEELFTLLDMHDFREQANWQALDRDDAEGVDRADDDSRPPSGVSTSQRRVWMWSLLERSSI